MPRTKPINHYPDRYQEILRECGLQGKQVSLQAESRTQALSFRGHWYAFLGALKAHVADLKRQQERRVLTVGEKELIDLAAIAPTVMLELKEQYPGPSCQLTFQSREHSWQAKLLATAKVTQGAASPTAAASLDETASRLLDLQRTVDGGKEDVSNS